MHGFAEKQRQKYTLYEPSSSKFWLLKEVPEDVGTIVFTQGYALVI